MSAYLFSPQKKKNWFEHKYGYARTQNQVKIGDNDMGESAWKADNVNPYKTSTIDHLLDTILSPGGAHASRENFRIQENTRRNLSLLKTHAKSGASGQSLLRGSPSTVEMIKQEARSHSTIVASMKSLRLPQLTHRHYVPSATLGDYKNSEIISHLELRQLE
jgi:hypothetical protein